MFSFTSRYHYGSNIKKQRSAPGPLGDFFQQQLADFPSYFLFLFFSFLIFIFSFPFYNFVFLILLSFLFFFFCYFLYLLSFQASLSQKSSPKNLTHLQFYIKYPLYVFLSPLGDTSTLFLESITFLETRYKQKETQIVTPQETTKDGPGSMVNFLAFKLAIDIQQH